MAAERVTNDGVVTVHFTRGLVGADTRHRLRTYVYTTPTVVSTLFVCEKRLNRYRITAIFLPAPDIVTDGRGPSDVVYRPSDGWADVRLPENPIVRHTPTAVVIEYESP